MSITIDEIDKIARSFMEPSILLSALELNIFEALGHEYKSAQDIASALDLSLRGTEILLDALSSMGILKKEINLYKNEPAVEEYLLKDSKEYPGGGLRHTLNLWHKWHELPTSVKTGKPVESHKGNKGRSASFYLAMAHYSKKKKEAVIDQLPLPKEGKVLDLGGGPGTYAISMAKKNPEIEVIIFDREDAREVAIQFIKEAKLEGRVKFLTGDFFKDDIGTGYDLIYISSVIHIYSDEDNRKLCEIAYKALKKGGYIVIRDFFVENDRIRPKRGAIFSVNMLINTEGGRTYSPDEIKLWFKETGFQEISFKIMDEDTILVMGKKL